MLAWSASQISVTLRRKNVEDIGQRPQATNETPFNPIFEPLSKGGFVWGSEMVGAGMVTARLMTIRAGVAFKGYYQFREPGEAITRAARCVGVRLRCGLVKLWRRSTGH